MLHTTNFIYYICTWCNSVFIKEMRVVGMQVRASGQLTFLVTLVNALIF